MYLTTYRLVPLLLCLLVSTGVQSDTVMLVCQGKTYHSLEMNGRSTPSSIRDGELVFELQEDRLIRGEMSADCVKTEQEIRCSANTADYEHSSVLNRYSGHMVLHEKLHTSTMSSILTADVRCSRAQHKF